MDKEKLYTYINDPDKLTASPEETLKSVVEAYPFFHTSRLLYTKYLDMIHSERYNEELSTTAILCADRRKLFYLIYKQNYHKLLEQPTEFPRKSKDRTDELLDSFLTSLGDDEIHATTLADGTLNMVSTDYLSYMESLGVDATIEQTADQMLQHHDIIDTFIEKAASETLFAPHDLQEGAADKKTSTEEDGGEFLTETLARIYIKQKKYEQALAIIKRLSLNFPKKSVYFADQIRFLEYLIANERSGTENDDSIEKK